MDAPGIGLTPILPIREWFSINKPKLIPRPETTHARDDHTGHLFYNAFFNILFLILCVCVWGSRMFV